MALTLRRALKWFGLAFAAFAVIALLVVVVGSVWIVGRLDGSLPQLDGKKRLPGLAAEVIVERDDHGVPTLRAANRSDLARATGFVHAQDRFFQMDLMRRKAAGELAEIVGPPVVEMDRGARVHRCRALAESALERLAPAERAILEAYAGGVQAGLDAMRYRPVEYDLLRSEPAPWKTEDSLLVVFAIYFDMQDETGRYESTLGLMRDLLPAELFEFLAPPGTDWDAPLIGAPFETPAVPTAAVFDLRTMEPALAGRRSVPREPEEFAVHAGSNNWAVAGSRAANGGALLANDMHLPLGMPNIWYRTSFVWPDGNGDELRVTGVTLPGVPTMVAGSNGHVAWGFTNTELDLSDLIQLEADGAGYRTPEGSRSFERFDERIRVKGAEDETLEVLWTRWGPVIDTDHLGHRRVIRWVAHEPDAVDLGLLEMERARDLDQALEIAARTRIPTLNVVVADKGGRVGWTLIGPVPDRRGVGGRLPSMWSEGESWNRWLEPDEYPRVVDPANGLVWTANNRVVDAALSERIGGGSFAHGARARQIRDGLLAVERATPEAMLAIQLDDRALLLERWRALLLEVLDDEATAVDPRRLELRRVVQESWTGRASIESAGYRMVRAFRLFLADAVLGAITASCAEADEDFHARRTTQWEGPLWRLVEERPPHLLSAEYGNWDEQFLDVVDRVLERFADDGGPPLAQRTWGARNTVRIQHPISLGLPSSLGFVAARLDAPFEPLPGDVYMPRVQSPRHGASERLVVSPGREEQGLYHMPGGQSGHPMSPYYRKGHDAWARGEATPFLPGPAAHRLTLSP